jgi:hypothetical protein
MEVYAIVLDGDRADELECKFMPCGRAAMY